MFDYLQGKLAEKKPSSAVIDVNGVGYKVEIPLSTFEALPKEGNVRLFTHMKVSDDEVRIYGFASQGERDLFRALIANVGGLGATRALTVLSQIDPGDLARCVEEADVGRLKHVKGIGEKLAQRMIVEMKGKITYVSKGGGDGRGVPASQDAVQALVALGYQYAEAREAVEKAVKESGANAELEDVIRRALQRL
ncbi:MAG: Holliday junction DNA helicase RuvA [Planctomycetes bacterium RBG_16_59_8]|nr:MAG: Holliday junction DNA helicase RuvA [Planctomycetes bacterium RBG_16_59_8]